MIFVACSGFPVPVSRYWTELPAVELAETELGIPGAGTVRRWMREPPKGYGFAILAPKTLAESGFARSAERDATVAALADLARKLKARAVVFNAPESFKPTKTSRTAIASFVKSIPTSFPTSIVLDLPAFKIDVLRKTAGSRVAIAYDPLADKPSPGGGIAYVRLPGPAGHRSRYDEDAIAKIAEHCRERAAEGDVFCVFRNIDMHANSRLLLEKLAELGRPATGQRRTKRQTSRSA